VETVVTVAGASSGDGPPGIALFVSEPYVHRFLLNKEMDEAAVCFRLSDKGGYYRFKRDNGQWQPVEWKFTYQWD